MIRFPNAEGRRRALRALLTFALAAAGGALFHWLGTPAGWLSGSVLTVAAASLMGFRSHVPVSLRPPIFLALGIFAGTGVRPETLSEIVTWPLSFAVLGITVALVILATYRWLRRAAGWDRDTALFSAMPGALSFVLAAAQDTRADMRRVAVTQTIRLLALIAFIPPFVLLFGAAPAASGARGEGGVDPAQLAILLAAGTVSGVLVSRTNLPGGLMLGGLAASAALYASGTLTTVIPGSLVAVGLVGLGALAGSRLRPEDRVILPGIAVAAVVAFLIGLVLSLAGAAAVMALLGVSLANALLAFAPGALETVVILAFALDADPAYVAAHHLVRFLALAFAAPFLGRWLRGKD